MMNLPGSPAVESNGLGRVCPRGPIMSPTVDEIAIGKNGDARPIALAQATGREPRRLYLMLQCFGPWTGSFTTAVHGYVRRGLRPGRWAGTASTA